MLFKLDKRLGNDTAEIGDLSLCGVLLFNDFRYPWLILVPKKPGLKEIDTYHAMTAFRWQKPCLLRRE